MEEARVQQIAEMYIILKWHRTFTNTDHRLGSKGTFIKF